MEWSWNVLRSILKVAELMKVECFFLCVFRLILFIETILKRLESEPKHMVNLFVREQKKKS